VTATQTILQSSPNSQGSVKWFRLDLSKRESIEEFAKNVSQEFDTIDILVNNAGMIMNDRQVNEMGVEMTMAVNHFGPFYLTYLLFLNIKKSKEARIINLSSEAHRHTSLVTSDDLPGLEFNSLAYYSKSKLANAQFTVGLS
jgi:retinol dehydrogenase 12